MDIVLAVIIGLFAGVIAGSLGVGGGVLFVPALIIIFNKQPVEAAATSLLAIVPVALVGAISQYRYGNLRIKDGLILGVLAIGGAAAGVVIANAVSGDTLRWAFAVLLVLIAAQMARRALRSETKTS
jgi:uncharacterized protein